MRGLGTILSGLSHRRAMLVVVLFASVTAFAGLFSMPPFDRDEARFAQATAQMLESGDFITIRFQDRERNKKPAGIYWLQAASVAALSDVDQREIWAYRVPSIIGAALAALFTFLAGARLYDVRTGLLAGLLLASAPLIGAEATLAKTDSVLLALVCMTQFAFIEIYARVQAGNAASWRWPLIFWIAQGAGVLIKGPLAPLISLLTGLGLTTGAPRFKWIAAMRPFSGLIILALMTLPWAAAIWQATDGRFFADALGNDMLGKVDDAQEGHVGSPGYHMILVWILFWPAAGLIVSGLFTAWKERSDWRARFLLSWFLPAWIVFEIAATKLPHYVMPLYPALAIIAAHGAVTVFKPGWSKKLGAVIYVGIGGIMAALTILAPMYYSDAPIAVFCYVAAAMTASASIAIATLLWRGRSYEGGLAAALLASVYAWTALNGVLPTLSRLGVSPGISTALEIVERHPVHDGLAPVILAGYSEPSAIFLLGTKTMLGDGAQAAARLIDGAASAAIIEMREEPAFHAALNGAQVSSLAVIDGLNYSKGDNVTLTIYRLAP